MHASGNVLGKTDVIKWAMSGDIKRDKIRVLFENDEIGVEHSFVTFNDGNTEAVMAITASVFPSLNVTNECSTPISSFSKRTLILSLLISPLIAHLITSVFPKTFPDACMHREMF